MEETKITFKQESDTYVSILLNGKEIAHIYSQMKDGGHPFPHNDTEYCLTSVQLCGFDKCSEVWSCGVFHGKKDLVVNFSDNESEYMQQQAIEYKRYVRDFINKGVSVDKLKDFQSWVGHLQHPRISMLPREGAEKPSPTHYLNHNESETGGKE